MYSQTRHLLATIAYRFDRVSEGLPPDFSAYAPLPGARTALHLLNQSINGLSFAEAVLTETDRITWETHNWQEGQHQFHFVLNEIDDYLMINTVDPEVLEILIQGPFSDVLTYIGQLTLMRRMHGEPMPRENYMRAAIRPRTKRAHSVRA